MNYFTDSLLLHTLLHGQRSTLVWFPGWCSSHRCWEYKNDQVGHPKKQILTKYFLIVCFLIRGIYWEQSHSWKFRVSESYFIPIVRNMMKNESHLQKKSWILPADFLQISVEWSLSRNLSNELINGIIHIRVVNRNQYIKQ